MNEVIAVHDGPTLRKESRTKPTPGPEQALVKIKCVAQNPTDVQSFDINMFGTGAILGCDFVGTVEEIGSDVTKIKKGDTVAALVWGGGMKGLGAYARYTLANQHIAFKVPSGVDLAAAATVPLAAGTAWLALFSTRNLNIPRGQGDSVLIWGGSSSVGQYAIQLAKLEGLKVVTTCSPKNFDLVEQLGADHVFDYRSSDIVDQVKSVAPELKYVFDTIGRAASSRTAASAVESDGRLCTVRPDKSHTEEIPARINITAVLVWTLFPDDYSFRGHSWPKMQEDNDLGAELFTMLPGLLESGKFKPNRPFTFKGLELENLEKGFEMNRQGQLSAQKIVYEVV